MRNSMRNCVRSSTSGCRRSPESIGTHYGCDIAFGREALGEILFTGTLDYNMPLRHVLEIVTLSTDTRFTRNGDKITIL